MHPTSLRKLVAAGIGAVLLGVAPAAAWAQEEEQPSEPLTIDEQASVDEDGNIVITGTIACDDAEEGQYGGSGIDVSAIVTYRGKVETGEADDVECGAGGGTGEAGEPGKWEITLGGGAESGGGAARADAPASAGGRALLDTLFAAGPAGASAQQEEQEPQTARVYVIGRTGKNVFYEKADVQLAGDN